MIGGFAAQDKTLDQPDSTRLKSKRTIWMFTALMVALALAVFAARVARDSFANVVQQQSTAEEREAAVSEMLELLERDSRVRRDYTRQVVESVARFANVTTPESAEVQYALGLWRYYGAYDVPGAVTAFQSAIALRPDWSWAHNGLGIVLFATGREDEGMAAFEEAMRLAPEWSRPYNDLAILYRRAGKMKGAVREIQRALEMDPDGAVTHYNYGVILDVQGHEDEAAAEYRRVIELDPTIPAPYYNIACGFARKGDATSAVNYLSDAVGLEEVFHEEAQRDPDFDAIRDEPEFVRFIETREVTTAREHPEEF